MEGVSPLLMELFKMLPAAGDEWPSEQRAAWLQAAAAAMELVYHGAAGHGRINVEVYRR